MTALTDREKQRQAERHPPLSSEQQRELAEWRFKTLALPAHARRWSDQPRFGPRCAIEIYVRPGSPWIGHQTYIETIHGKKLSRFDRIHKSCEIGSPDTVRFAGNRFPVPRAGLDGPIDASVPILAEVYEDDLVELDKYVVTDAQRAAIGHATLRCRRLAAEVAWQTCDHAKRTWPSVNDMPWPETRDDELLWSEAAADAVWKATFISMTTAIREYLEDRGEPRSLGSVDRYEVVARDGEDLPPPPAEGGKRQPPDVL